MMDWIQRAPVRLVSLAVLFLSIHGEIAAQQSERSRAGSRQARSRLLERQQRAHEADLAAGDLVDSLFTSDIPGAANGPQASTSGVRRGGWRGRLALNPDSSDGSPPYVVLDRYGGVKRFVEPSDRVDLESYLGEMVMVRRDTGQTLLASQYALPREAHQPDQVADPLEHNDEEIPPGQAAENAGEPLVVPEGVDPVYVDSGLNFGACDQCGPGGCAVGGCCGDGCCGGGCGGCGCGFGSRPILYVRAEYLQWWFDGMNTPPLVGTFDETDADGPVTIAYGGNDILDSGRSGVKILVGSWLDDYGKWGIEGDYFGFSSEGETFVGGSLDPQVGMATGRLFNSTGILGLGLLDPGQVVGPSVQDVSVAGELAGIVTVTSNSDFLMSGIRLRHNICCKQGCAPQCGDCVDCGAGVTCGSGCCLQKCPLFLGYGVQRVDVTFGIRHAQLEDSLRIDENLEELVDDESTFVLFDSFATSNEFVGASLGMIWEWEYRRWSLELLSQLALGNTRQRVFISGQTSIDGGDPLSGGLLALPSNIGAYERNEFSVLPELNATIGYNLTKQLRFTFGYSFVYWSRVARPGDQIDLNVNPTNIPRQGGVATEPMLPAFAFHDTALWAHGLNVGADYRW